MKRLKRAFTIVEIIISIAALGVLYGMSSVSFSGYRSMSKQEQRKMNIQLVKNAVDNYYSKYNKYPTSPIEKQPSPDVTDGTGKKTSGYSKVDIDLLVNTERYLEQAPTLQKDEFFAVNYNGVVTIETQYMESVLIENGAAITKANAGNTLKFDVYVDTTKTVQSIKVLNASGGDYLVSSTGYTFPSTAVSSGKVEANVPIKATPGQKKFSVEVSYGDGTKKTLSASIQYAVENESLNDTPYWINPLDKTDKTSPITMTYTADTTNATIKLDWNSYYTNNVAAIIKYKIVRNAGGTVDATFYTDRKTYIDNTIKGSIAYTYNIYAMNVHDVLTTNYLTATTTDADISYTNNLSSIENLTKNDYNTAYNKEIAVRVSDNEGIRSVTCYVAQVVGNTLATGFTPYQMYRTEDGSLQDVFTVPIEVKDDYMIYYIKVIDNRGYVTYSYYDTNLARNADEIVTKGATETEEEFEIRETAADTKYENRKNIVDDSGPYTSGAVDITKCYVLMRGLREIYSDDFVDNLQLDTTISKFHMFDGKITLP